MYTLLSELLHDSLCNLPTFYNLSKSDLLSLRLSSNKCSLVISAARITTILDYSGATTVADTKACHFYCSWMAHINGPIFVGSYSALKKSWLHIFRDFYLIVWGAHQNFGAKYWVLGDWLVPISSIYSKYMFSSISKPPGVFLSCPK